MNSKLPLIIFAILLNVFCVRAQEIKDSVAIDSQINLLFEEMNALKQEVAEIEAIKANIQKNAYAIKKLNEAVVGQREQIEVAVGQIQENKDEIQSVNQASIEGLEATNKSIAETSERLASNISRKAILTIILSIIVLVVAIVFYLLNRRKNSSTEKAIAKLNAESAELCNNMVSANSKLVDLIEKQLKTLEEQPVAAKEVDHSLAIAVANELARIQQNLNQMDSSVKGVSQLKNRAKAIISTLNSKQYEIPELLGKEYHEGANMIATMETNEDLPAGSNRIVRVIKPQVSYAGKLIQAAEVVVEFND